MINKTKYILILLLATVIYDAAAQNSQVLYYMNLPQRHLLNPAFRPTNAVYIGLPGLSGINFNFNNNFISFQDVFMKSPVGDSVISILHPDYDVNRFIEKINDINSFGTQAQVQLFGLGFNAGEDLYIFLDINERVEGNIALPGDILRLAFLGNEQFVGNKMDLSALTADLRSYTELGFGFSKNFMDDLRIGVKGKLLFGIATASVLNNSLGITVNEDYTHVFDANMAVNISAPFIYTENSDGNIEGIEIDTLRLNSTRKTIKYFLSPENLGLGLDIGAEYKITDRVAVSASITDLGFIRWNRDAKNIRADSRFEFSGIDMLDVYNRDISIDSLVAEIVDSLANSFNYDNSEAPFTTTIAPGLSVGGSFNLTKSVSVGLLSYTKFVGKQVREALTLSANVNFGNALSASVGYTAANHRYDNLGAGLAFRTGWVQFYFLTDNIPIAMNKIKFTTSDDPDGPGPEPERIKDHSIWIPQNLQTIHFRFGMNLAFGNKAKKKADKPMLTPEENIIPRR